jgi:hypothetical protein
MALVISPKRTDATLADLSIAVTRDAAEETRIEDPALEVLRKGIPAARSLPLLAAVACGCERDVAIAYIARNQVTIHVGPVSLDR